MSRLKRDNLEKPLKNRFDKIVQRPQKILHQSNLLVLRM